MYYRSTRGAVAGQSFEAAVLGGLAPDGGLYIPERIPAVTAEQLAQWSSLAFPELAAELFALYVDSGEITKAELETLATRSYATFRHPDITPIRALSESQRLSVLELFHGPTFAFKDVALQFLGNLFEFLLQRRNAHKQPGDRRDRITVVGATSGDTGSAAIYGLRGKRDISVFILHPRGRVSPVQERQMTTVLDANVHNVAVEGTFDDCQDIVKQLFADDEFRVQYSLGAVNSINWARILAQIVYYFFAYFQAEASGLKRTDEPLVFSVPTGNFGDILAGYYAQRMGLPIRLICATNENDILDRFFRTGIYSKSSDGVAQTWAPAMDICVSSNFERLAWYLARDTVVEVEGHGAEAERARDVEASAVVAAWWTALKSHGGFQVDAATVAKAGEVFLSAKVSNDEMLATICAWYERSAEEHGTPYVLDPHTAVGVKAAEKLRVERSDCNGPIICLSTAHPAKFDEAVERALANVATQVRFSFDDIRPVEIEALAAKERRCEQVPEAEAKLIKEVVRQGLQAEGIAI
ncbi:threonine synthase [Syncephalis pseudoplumigaleata]|uniref:threonine synthase n=1 Tax=Syncephalis pseudoplumigaleata TaxID=1712513 RepID=A0A4P9Z2J1_9FUNG|nr:threonine synthase [Syncephalis pseudoplumigaleata]|eukprot:RKP26001.1 threonine synthase [Syncephalis pseudoplumigaleata]